MFPRHLAHFAHDCFICSQWADSAEFSKYRDRDTCHAGEASFKSHTPPVWCRSQ